MNKIRISIISLLLTLLFSCKQERENIQPPSFPDPPAPAAPAVLLKDVVIPNLPSPYYHFEYDTTGKVSFASFASGFNTYDVMYEDGRILQLKNNGAADRDRLEYFYDNTGRVNTVQYIDPTGVTYAIIHFTYDGQKLIKVERERRSPSGYVINKTMTFSYYPDGNLMEITDHRPAVVNLQNETTTIDRFEQYDSKLNVDGFSLIHNDFFDHLVLLPGVQLQKNNPRKETLTGDGDNYSTVYTYTYNEKDAPITKTGQLTILNGANAGQTFQTSSTFSYY